MNIIELLRHYCATITSLPATPFAFTSLPLGPLVSLMSPDLSFIKLYFQENLRSIKPEQGLCTRHGSTFELPRLSKETCSADGFLEASARAFSQKVLWGILRSREITPRFAKGMSTDKFRVRQFTEWPWPLHWMAFPVDFLLKPSFTECLALT